MAHLTHGMPAHKPKRAVIQPMRVTWPSGWQTTVCCGPAALQACRQGATAYRPIGTRQHGHCCHTSDIG